MTDKYKILGKYIKDSSSETADLETYLFVRDRIEKYPGSQVNLDALCKKYRIDNSRRTYHTALIDCDLLAKVYINLLDQKEPTLDFKRNSQVEEYQNNKLEYYKKIVLPTSDELKRHKEYLKNNLKKNYFN